MALVASPAHDWTINALIEMFKMNWFTNEKPLPEIVQIAMATEDDGMNGLIDLFKKNWFFENHDVTWNNNRSLELASSLNFRHRSNYIKIEMPPEDGQPKVSYLFTHAKWVELWSLIDSMIEQENNFEPAGDRITEYISDSDEQAKETIPCDDNDDSSDWDISGEQLSPEELDKALYELYHMTK